MEDTEDGENTNPPIKAPRQNRWGRFVGYIKRKLHERKTKKEHESPTDRAARRTAHATVWIAAFTVVMALVGAGTLYEIIEGGHDTHDLAVAAGKQADRMKDFADRMKDQADRTKTIAEQAVNQSATQLGQLNEIKATDRAFVFTRSVDTVVGPAINGEPGYAWNIALENSGTTPTKELTIGIQCGFGGQFGDPIDMQHVYSTFRAMIGPKSTQLTHQCSALSRFVSEQSSHGWYVFGYAKYKDVFRSQHLTEFCWQNQIFINPNEVPSMIPCTGAGAQFNCVDRECADYDKITKPHNKPKQKRAN